MEQELDGLLSPQVMSDDAKWDFKEAEYSEDDGWVGDVKSEGGLLMEDVDVRVRSGRTITFTYHLY